MQTGNVNVGKKQHDTERRESMQKPNRILTPHEAPQSQRSHPPKHGPHRGPQISEDQLRLLDESNAKNEDFIDDWALDPATRCVGLAGVQEARELLFKNAKRRPIAKAS
jgi:hypothetical protein